MKTNNSLNILITKLIHSYLGVLPSDQYYDNLFNFTNNYLNVNSMMYIPTIKDIEERIYSLLEKFEINSQIEKAKLIKDLIKRLNTIFTKNNIDKNTLYYLLLIIIQLAHSPLQNNIDIDMLRERFEERYIRIQSDIIKNSKNCFYEYENRKYFEPVNYDSDSIIIEDEENEIDIKKDNQINNLNIKEEHSKTSLSEILISKLNDKISKSELRMNIYNLMLIIKFQSNYLLHCFRMNLRFDEIKLRKLNKIQYKSFKGNHNIKNYISLNSIDTYKICVNSDYFINMILIRLNNSNENRLIFENYNCLDISSGLLQNIFNEFNEIIKKLVCLRTIKTKFEFNCINQSTIIQNLTYIINQFLSCNDKIVTAYLKLINYQNGKIIKYTNKIETILEIDIELNENRFFFFDTLIHKTNENIKENLNRKLTIHSILSIYKINLLPYINYFFNLTEEIILINNKYSPKNDILNKYILDL